MPAPRSARAFKVPAGPLAGSLSLVGQHPDRVKAFALAWGESFLSERVQLCRLAGVPESFASLAWADVRGDLQCFISARFFVCFDVLAGFLQRVNDADACT